MNAPYHLRWKLLYGAGNAVPGKFLSGKMRFA